VSEGHTAAILRQALCALAFLHGAGIAHGNVNGSNLFIEASTGLVKLITEIRSCAPKHPTDAACNVHNDRPHSDSGILSAHQTAASRRPSLGSRSAPCCHPTAFADDIYALGCTAAGLLSGAGPAPHRPAGLTLAAAAFLAECLASDPAERATARELLGHPYLLLLPAGDAACGAGDCGGPPAAGELSALLDDVLVIDDSERRRPPPPRPACVPGLRAPAPAAASAVCFSSPSQTARAAAAATADCCPLRRLMAPAGPSAFAPRKRPAAAAAAAAGISRRDRRRVSAADGPLPGAGAMEPAAAAAAAALAA
jgi:hypothetical protein